MPDPDIAVRVPWWAIRAGLPPPGGESFRVYWRMVGFTDDEIDWLLSGLRPGAEDVANDRAATWLASKVPGIVEASAQALSAGTHRKKPL